MINLFKYSKYIACCAVLVLNISCTEEQNRDEVYLEDAKKYIMDKDWRAAISQLQNFISIENEASLEDRAEAWFLMAEVRLALNQIKESYDVLEYMLDEPDYDMEVRAEIYKRLIALYDRANLFSQAAQARIKYALHGHLSAEENAKLLIDAAKSYQGIARYEDSLLVLQDALQYTDKLEDTNLTSFVYYYKAYAENVLGKQDLAVQSLLNALHSLGLPSLLNAENISNLGTKTQNKSIQIHEDNKEITGLIYYLLADIQELVGDNTNALVNFYNALKYYPNRLFIQKRIDLLNESEKSQEKK